jgi:hypothetical protein
MAWQQGHPAEIEPCLLVDGQPDTETQGRCGAKTGDRSRSLIRTSFSGLVARAPLRPVGQLSRLRVYWKKNTSIQSSGPARTASKGDSHRPDTSKIRLIGTGPLLNRIASPMASPSIIADGSGCLFDNCPLLIGQVTWITSWFVRHLSWLLFGCIGRLLTSNSSR